MSELTTPFLYIINMSKLSQPFSLHWWIAPMFSFPKHLLGWKFIYWRLGCNNEVSAQWVITKNLVI